MSYELTEFAEGFVQGCHNKGMTFDEMQKSAALASENIPGVADDLACLLTKEAGGGVKKFLTKTVPDLLKKTPDAAKTVLKKVHDVGDTAVKKIVGDAADNVPQMTARTVPGGGSGKSFDFLNDAKQQWRNAEQTNEFYKLKKQLDALEPGAERLKSDLLTRIGNLPPSAQVFRDRLTKELADINKRGHRGVFNATDEARRLAIQKQLHNMPAPLKSAPPIKPRPVPHLTRAQVTQELSDINKRGYRGNLNAVDQARQLELQKQLHKFTPRSHPTLPVRPPTPELTAAAQQQIKVLERALSKAKNPSIRKGMTDQINKLKNQFDPVMMDAVKQFDLNEAARLKATSPKPQPPPMLKQNSYATPMLKQSGFGGVKRFLMENIPGWLKKLKGGADDVVSQAPKAVDGAPIRAFVDDIPVPLSAANNAPRMTARTVPGGGSGKSFDFLIDDVTSPKLDIFSPDQMIQRLKNMPASVIDNIPGPAKAVGRAITNPGGGALAGAGGDYAVQTFGDATGLYDYDDYYLTGLGALTGGARMFPNTRLGSRATRAIDWARAPSAAAKDKGWVKRWISSPEGRLDLSTLLVDAGGAAAHAAVGGNREDFRNDAEVYDTARRYLSDPGHPVADDKVGLLQVAEAELARNKELDRLVTIGEITPEERGQYEAFFQNEYQQELARKNPSAPPILDTVSPQTDRAPAEVLPIDTSADTTPVSTPVETEEASTPTEEAVPTGNVAPGVYENDDYSQLYESEEGDRFGEPNRNPAGDLIRGEEDFSELDTPIALEPNVDPASLDGAKPWEGVKLPGKHYGITNGIKRWWNNLGTKGQVGAVMGVLGLLGGPLMGSRGNTGLGMGSSALGGLLLADLMGLFGEPGQYSNMIAQKIGIGDLGIKARDPDMRFTGTGPLGVLPESVFTQQTELPAPPTNSEAPTELSAPTDSEAPAEDAPFPGDINNDNVIDEEEGAIARENPGTVSAMIRHPNAQVMMQSQYDGSDAAFKDNIDNIKRFAGKEPSIEHSNRIIGMIAESLKVSTEDATTFFNMALKITES